MTKEKILYIKKRLIIILSLVVLLIIFQILFNNLFLSQYINIIVFSFFVLFISLIVLDIISNNYSIHQSINKYLYTYLTTAVATVIIFTSLGCLLFINDKYLKPPNENQLVSVNEQSNNPVGSSSNMNDEALLSIIAILITFSGFFAAILSYAFHRIVKNEIQNDMQKKVERVLQKTKDSTHNERLASKTEMHISASNIFSRLYKLLNELSEKIDEEGKILQDKNQILYEDLEKEGKRIETDESFTLKPELDMITKLYCLHKNQRNFLCELSNNLKSKDFLSEAINHDLLASNLIKKITDLTNYRDVKLKTLNNRAYNIYLKQDRQDKWLKLNKGKESNIPIKFQVENIEIHNAIEAREELFNFILNKDICLCEDINDYHLTEWKDTCEAVKSLTDKGLWKEIYKERNFSSN